MRNVVSRSFTTLAVLALALVGLNAQFKPAQRMPATASEYAWLVEPGLGGVPTIDCARGDASRFTSTASRSFTTRKGSPATTPTSRVAATWAHG